MTAPSIVIAPPPISSVITNDPVRSTTISVTSGETVPPMYPPKFWMLATEVQYDRGGADAELLADGHVADREGEPSM